MFSDQSGKCSCDAVSPHYLVHNSRDSHSLFVRVHWLESLQQTYRWQVYFYLYYAKAPVLAAWPLMPEDVILDLLPLTADVRPS
jgi:hypothetical protein